MFKARVILVFLGFFFNKTLKKTGFCQLWFFLYTAGHERIEFRTNPKTNYRPPYRNYCRIKRIGLLALRVWKSQPKTLIFSYCVFSVFNDVCLLYNGTDTIQHAFTIIRRSFFFWKSNISYYNTFEKEIVFQDCTQNHIVFWM